MNAPLVPVLRVGPLSLVHRPRPLLAVVVTAVAVLATAVVALGLGDLAVTPSRVVGALLGEGTPRELLVVRTVRLPRILTGIAAGAALGVAGALVQTVARNALASPDLLGVTAGASAGAVAVITLGGAASASGVLREVGVPAAALVGAVLASAAVILLTGRRGLTGVQPLLVGIGVSAFFAGAVNLFLVAAPIKDAARANVWLTGSLNQRSWPELWPLAASLLVCAVVLVPLHPRLAALHLGPDVARSLGVPLVATTGAFAAVAALLTAVAAASVGPLGFVALVAPHAARLLSGTTRAPLCCSAVVGALVVAVSDLVARLALAPVQLPAGAIIALVGGPFLAALLVTSSRRTAP